MIKSHGRQNQELPERWLRSMKNRKKNAAINFNIRIQKMTPREGVLMYKMKRQ